LATEYTLRRGDGKPLGTFEDVQAALRRLFPGVRFWWTTSGPEKIRQAEERGVELPPMIRQTIEKLPSMLDGICEGDGFTVEFGLGPSEPVSCLCVQPRGASPELLQRLGALEAEFGGTLVVAGSEPNPV
jgi:hypothetical protein